MALHTRSHRAPCSHFPKRMSLQLSWEKSVGDVGITQLEWKRVPQARSRNCKSSVTITAECSRHHASRNVSWPQRAPSAVGHETTVIGQVERHLPGQRLANQAIGMPLWTWRALGWVANGVQTFRRENTPLRWKDRERFCGFHGQPKKQMSGSLTELE